MHVADLSIGMLGANGIVGASAELATGAAFAAKVKGTDQVAVGVLGDGGMAEGAVHESMNLAALWKLPVVFFCENNRYAVTLPVSGSVAADPICGLAGDPNFGPYRSKEEWQAWQAKDPIPRYAAEIGLEGDLDAMRADADAAMDAASAFAQASPLPDLSTAFDHVFPSGLRFDEPAHAPGA